MYSELYHGKHDFARFPLPGGNTGCLQADIPAAKDTLSRIRVLEQQHGVHVAFAHDNSWMLEGTDEVLMSLLSDELKHAAQNVLPTGGLP